MSSLTLSVILGGVGLMSSTFYYFYNYIEAQKNEIESITSIEDVVLYVKKIAKMKDTDGIIDHILICLNSKPLSDECIQRLCIIHKEHGKGLGIDGYAINLLWSTIIFSYTTDTTKINQ